MGAEGGGAGWPRRYARIAADTLAYALVVTVGAVALALVLGVTTGGSLARAKVVLFLIGWLLMAIAVVRLWPSTPEGGADVTTGGEGWPVGATPETRVETIAATATPVRWMERPSPRLSPPAKLFVASLAVLATSFVLETAFAVG